MVVEAIAIITIFILLLFGFLRAGKKDYAVAILPLVLVPLIQVLISLTMELFAISLGADMKSTILIIGLVLSIILTVLASQLVKSKRSRLIFIILCSCFTTLLTFIFLYNNYYG